MNELRGIPLADGDDITIPIYIFEKSNLIASGEGLISKINGRYFGAFDFEVPETSRYTVLSPQVDFWLNLVHGSLGQRTSIGEVRFTCRDGKEFTGAFEFHDDPNLDILMRTARSLVNI